MSAFASTLTDAYWPLMAVAAVIQLARIADWLRKIHSALKQREQ